MSGLYRGSAIFACFIPRRRSGEEPAAVVKCSTRKVMNTLKSRDGFSSVLRLDFFLVLDVCMHRSIYQSVCVRVRAYVCMPVCIYICVNT